MSALSFLSLYMTFLLALNITAKQILTYKSKKSTTNDKATVKDIRSNIPRRKYIQRQC